MVKLYAFLYDTYGNVQTIQDPKDNPPTTITYDTVAQTYPATIQNPLGHTVNKTYDYGFGKPLTETDPNNNTTTYEYDIFGRLTKVTNPNDTNSTYGTISYSYLDFGTIGSQRVVTYATEQSGTGNYIWSETYFDGLGRAIKTRSEGPDTKVIVQRTFYDNRGHVSYVSLPYFEGTETERQTYFKYDPIDRVKKVTNPDGTYVTKNYLRGSTTLVDANGHQKIEERDVYGRLTKVKEYTGVSPNVTLYATTTYQYDVLGNLTKVTDANNNQTTLTYDSLSRKTSMTDPDMGYWVYQYDANGNLTYQKDAKNQIITFTYDALNRITKKDYPTGTDTVYTYDQTFSANSKGRLTTIADASGTTKFYYNRLGQTVKIIKTVDSINYTTQTTYDALGRAHTITYPDSTVIKYEYDTGGNLYRVKDNSTGFVYAAYTDYNALGQIGRIDFGNGVNTVYQYLPQNNRLYSINTSSPNPGFSNLLISLSYTYDNVGNITGIADYPDITRNRTYGYDDLNRLTSATSPSYGGTLTWQYNTIGNMAYNSRYGNYSYTDPDHVHAVTQAGTDTYQYDANGNMISGAGRTITYNYDNMPTSITRGGVTTTSVYDANGQRVKKVTDGFTTIYLGKYCEYTNGTCTKYIFGGSDRIASIEGPIVLYYHTDHLGSSSVITGENGNSVQSMYYYPYGEIHTNGFDIARYKFTGQEYDAETELYYYNARYYDPKLARFVTADTIVPDLTNPQVLNRYSYVINNPLLYTDPTGHFFVIDDMIIGAIVGAIIGGTTAAVTDGDIGMGILTGAITGAFMGGAGGLAFEITDAGYTLSSVAQAGIYTAAGAMAGATNASIYGADIGQGALLGGAFGLAGYLAQVPDFQLFGDSAENAYASIANRVFNAGITGAAFGATYTGMTGGDIGYGAMVGAFAWAAGEGVNMGIGHAVGYIASGGNAPTFENGAFYYDANNTSGWITFGNVVTGPYSKIDKMYTVDGMQYTIRQHERGHMPQGTVLGPAYVPAHAASLTVGGLIGTFTDSGFMNGTHRFGFLERYWHPAPSY
ncbi:MAG: RHS repeat-associated core domain-containing protein [Candidatus Jettenia sp. CY-1]|nr:MAG: RHS repeat-associated core domain-containing protein [Candidatus Jettenia sp. CY-1]